MDAVGWLLMTFLVVLGIYIVQETIKDTPDFPEDD